MLVTILGFSALLILIYASISTVEKKPHLRKYWMILGCILFFLGTISLVVNSVGLTLGTLQWVEQMGKLGSFLFKVFMIMSGVIIFVLVNHNPEAYDEYFDGNKYKE